MANDVTLVRPGVHRCTVRSVWHINDIAYLDIVGIGSAGPGLDGTAHHTGCHRGADLPSDPRGRHRLRDQRRDERLAHDDDTAARSALLMPV